MDHNSCILKSPIFQLQQPPFGSHSNPIIIHDKVIKSEAPTSMPIASPRAPDFHFVMEELSTLSLQEPVNKHPIINTIQGNSIR